MTKSGTVLTVGHSNRPLAEFLDLLSAHNVDLLADIRTVPRSRHNSQFDRDTLPSALETRGIRYTHLAGLGGLRRLRPDSINTAWTNASFRGYADYMQTPDFDRALEELLRLVAGHRTTIMCAESVPWRCHRSLVADALTVRGIGVRHILSTASPKLHRITPFAAVDGFRLWYPGTGRIFTEDP
jgi:uncharacterized protein (DUF488 family)